MTRTEKTIYLFLIDDSISPETGTQMKSYCEAYFTGATVELKRPGDALNEKNSAGKLIKKKTLPVDFVGAHNITTRDKDGIKQLHASEILSALKQYKVNDTFCILAMTNQDVYPGEEWNYVFGLANQASGCGIFSFCRHQIGFHGEESKKTEEEKSRTWLKRSIGTMTHEIGHMFGLKHCTYYECTMNGKNGPGDGAKVKNKTMCPVCLLKLKLNLKFTDSRARYAALAEASRAIGLENKALNYERL